MKNGIRKTGNAALRLLYPPRCPLCDRLRPARSALALERAKRPAVPSLVCEDCSRKLPWVTEPLCMKCGKPVGRPEEEYCEDCSRIRHLFECGRAAFTYSGAMRGSVYRMKFQNRRDYLDFYAEAMVKAGERVLPYWRPELIVPIPMHRRKRAARGYNQSELLAIRISHLAGIPCARNLLHCVRYTENQKELGRGERLRNLRGSFEVHAPGDFEYSRLPARILLVDDVYTTGSTMDEASRAMLLAGAHQIFFLVLCTGNGKKVCMT